jgi:hypothetical protein
MKTALISLLVFNAVFLLLIIRRCYWAKPAIIGRAVPPEIKPSNNPLRAVERTCGCCHENFWVTSDYKDHVCPSCVKNNCGIGM